jgi:hypothetical protein
MVRRVTVDIRTVPQQLQFEDSRQGQKNRITGHSYYCTRFVTVERPDRRDSSELRTHLDRSEVPGSERTFGFPKNRVSVHPVLHPSVQFCLVIVVIT